MQICNGFTSILFRNAICSICSKEIILTTTAIKYFSIHATGILEGPVRIGRRIDGVIKYRERITLNAKAANFIITGKVKLFLVHVIFFNFS